MGRRKTNDEFQDELKRNNFWAYDNLQPLESYKGIEIKMVFSSKYGNVLMRPSVLLRGGRPDIRSAVHRTAFWINQVKEVHGDKYDYSKSVCINNSVSILIICPKHGEFSMKSNSHLDGQGCKK